MLKEDRIINNLKFAQLLDSIAEKLKATSNDVSDGVFLEMIEDGFIQNKFLIGGKWVTNETYSGWRNGKVPGDKNCANMAKYDKEASNAEVAEKYFSRYLAKKLLEKKDTAEGMRQIREFLDELQKIEGTEVPFRNIEDILKKEDESELISFFEIVIRCSIKNSRRNAGNDTRGKDRPNRAAAKESGASPTVPLQQAENRQGQPAILQREYLKSEDLDEAIDRGFISARTDRYSDMTKAYGQRFLMGDSHEIIHVAYKELFGILQGITFDETNMELSYTDESSEIYKYVENVLHYDMKGFRPCASRKFKMRKTTVTRIILQSYGCIRSGESKAQTVFLYL